MNYEQNKEQALESIEQILEQYTIPDQLEIIANYFIQVGIALMDDGDILPDQIPHEDLMDIILKHRLAYGETLGSSLTHQGLVLLMWLETVEKGE